MSGPSSLDFASDNVVGASDRVADALADAARAGAEGTYGADRWTLEAARQLEAVFERRLEVRLVSTGTAANAIALSLLTPAWGGVLCHAGAHVNVDECGAPEFFTAGAKLFGIAGHAGKVTAPALRDTLARFPRGALRQVEPMALSLSQATECGTIYRPDEIAALTAIAREAGLGVHMDGARFANALIACGCSPAEMTWKAGIDILSFGATKNGALACEAVIVFDPDARRPLDMLRKRSGHTLSKGRLLGAQMAVYLRDDHWLELARHANAMAARLAEGLAGLGFRLPWPCEANEVFVVLPAAVHDGLQTAGVHYYEWDAASLPAATAPGPDERFVRLIASFATTVASVDRLLAIAAAARHP